MYVKAAANTLNEDINRVQPSWNESWENKIPSKVEDESRHLKKRICKICAENNMAESRKL